MTSGLRKKIAKAQGLLDALRMLQDEPAISGALKVKAGSEEGTIALSKGRITDAAVSPTGERGQAALEKLAHMKADGLRYAKFHELMPFGQVLDVTLEGFIRQVSSNGDAAPAATVAASGSPLEAAAPETITASTLAVAQPVLQAVAAGAAEDFETKHDRFNDDNLSHHQRGVLEAAAELQDQDLNFHEQHPQMDETASYEQLKARQEALLAKVKHDDKPFDYVEKHIVWDTPSLTEEQRMALQQAALEGTDLRTFEQVNEFLHVKGFGLTPEQEADLRWIASERTHKEQQDEFHDKDENFVLDESTPEMKALLDKERQEKEGDLKDELDKIKTPEVEGQDRVPLKLLADKPQIHKRKDKPWSIIGRVSEYVGFSSPWNDKWKGYNFLHSQKKLRTGPEAFLGAFCLFAMCLGIFIIPATIKDANDKNAEVHARERLRQTVHEDLAGDSPQENAEIATARTNPTPVVNQGTTSHGFEGNFAFSPETDDLRFGRYLVTRGRIEAAIPYYEKYLTLDPESNQARIELINAYIATRQRYKARKLCIKAIKHAEDPKELAALWQLLSQCQTD